MAVAPSYFQRQPRLADPARPVTVTSRALRRASSTPWRSPVRPISEVSATLMSEVASGSDVTSPAGRSGLYEGFVWPHGSAFDASAFGGSGRCHRSGSIADRVPAN